MLPTNELQQSSHSPSKPCMRIQHLPPGTLGNETLFRPSIPRRSVSHKQLEEGGITLYMGKMGLHKQGSNGTNALGVIPDWAIYEPSDRTWLNFLQECVIQYNPRSMYPKVNTSLNTWSTGWTYHIYVVTPMEDTQHVLGSLLCFMFSEVRNTTLSAPI